MNTRSLAHGFVDHAFGSLDVNRRLRGGSISEFRPQVGARLLVQKVSEQEQIEMGCRWGLRHISLSFETILFFRNESSVMSDRSRVMLDVRREELYESLVSLFGFTQFFGEAVREGTDVSVAERASLSSLKDVPVTAAAKHQFFLLLCSF